MNQVDNFDWDSHINLAEQMVSDRVSDKIHSSSIVDGSSMNSLKVPFSPKKFKLRIKNEKSFRMDASNSIKAEKTQNHKFKLKIRSSKEGL